MINQKFFTVGPNQLYPTVIEHIQTAIEQNICSVSHRGQVFKNLFAETKHNLQKLLNIPDDYHVFFVGSATEAMEIAIRDCVGQTSYHFVNGAFSEKLYLTAKDLNKKSEKIEVETGQDFAWNNLNIPATTEMFCFTHSETSAGTYLPLPEVYALQQKFPNKLFAIDIVSSVPVVNLDYKKFDLVFFSVQKGFGLPAGLGVMIVNDRCIEKAKILQANGFDIGGFHNLLSLVEKEQENQTPETPNVLNIFLLNKVLEDMNKIGIEKIRKKVFLQAEKIYDFFDSHPQYRPAVENKKLRSQTIIVIETGKETKNILTKLAADGLVVSSGYGKFKDSQIRIANFPAHDLDDFKKLFEGF